MTLSNASNRVKYKLQQYDSEGMKQERPCKVQQSHESVKRDSIDHFDWEFIPRDWEPHREGCFPQDRTKTSVAQLEVMTTKVSFRWSLERYRLWQVKGTVEYVTAHDEVSAKPAALARKDIQSAKPVIIWQPPHALDHDFDPNHDLEIDFAPQTEAHVALDYEICRGPRLP